MAKETDLTQGNLKLHFIHLAAPLIVGNILQQLYNTVDALVIGRYAGYMEFAAIGIAGSVMNLFLFAIVGACTGISVIFAQLSGAGDHEGFRREHFLSLVLGFLTTAVISIIGFSCISLILHAVQTPEELMKFAGDYLSIVMLSMPISFIYNLYSALLRSVGRTNAALGALVVAVAINLALDVLFIGKWHIGITGAAWATAAAQTIAALVCLLYLRLRLPDLIFRSSDCKLDTDLMKKTGHYSLVMGLSQTGLYIGKLLVQGAVNTAGTDMVAAYTATTRIEAFTNSFGDSGAAATSVLTAQNLGAGKYNRVEECFRSSFFLLLVLGLISSAILFVTSGMTTGFLLDQHSGAGFESAKQYIQIIAVFYTWCFIGNAFAGYFEGCGKVSIPFIGAVGHITFRVIVSWIWISHTGLNGVAIATGIGWVGVNVFWGLYYRKFRNHLK